MSFLLYHLVQTGHIHFQMSSPYLPIINCIKLITKAEMIKAIHVFQLPKPTSREILSLFLTSFGSCFISSSSRSSITWFATTSSCSSVIPLSCSMVNERNSSFVIMLFFILIDTTYSIKAVSSQADFHNSHHYPKEAATGGTCDLSIERHYPEYHTHKSLYKVPTHFRLSSSTPLSRSFLKEISLAPKQR